MSASYELVIDSRRDRGAPRISVVVATKDRAGTLEQLLVALREQSLPIDEFEVVIADDGSTDTTQEVLHRAARDLQLAVVRSTRSFGASRARNAAWRSSRGPFVAFTDDDCLPVPDWLRSGLSVAQQTAGVVAGRTLPDPDTPIGPFSRYPAVSEARWMPTCNVFYRRTDLEAVGGFDEAFPFGGEDTDLAYRVRERLSRDFVFAPNALTYHEVRPNRFRAALSEALRYRGIPLFFKRYPEAREFIWRKIFWKRSHATTVLAAVGLAAAPFTIWAVLLVAPWLHFRLRRERPGRRLRAHTWLPGTFVVDLAEVVTMVRGSIRHKTIVL